MKNHITIDSEYMLIRHKSVKKGPRFDIVFAISAIRSIKEYKPKYILADKAYDTKKNKKEYNQRNNSNTTNEETPKNRKIQNKI